MIHVEIDDVIPDGEVKLDIPFFLTLEEWVAEALPRGEYFFAWTVPPSVIMGRHQDASVEIDAGYCRAHGIGVYRRSSGGGCVYADRDNVMLSFIVPGTDVTVIFPRVMEGIAAYLRTLGLDARVSGRNDVLVDGRKVSGSAYHRLTDCSIVHATLLVDTDMPNMLGALTPSRSKLARHGVSSVEGRITTLVQLIDGVTADEVKRGAEAYFGDTAFRLSLEQMAQVAARAQAARQAGMVIIDTTQQI